MSTVTVTIPRAQALALIERKDLTAQICERAMEDGKHFRGLPVPAHTGGGSALDRKNALLALQAIEAAVA